MQVDTFQEEFQRFAQKWKYVQTQDVAVDLLRVFNRLYKFTPESDYSEHTRQLLGEAIPTLVGFIIESDREISAKILMSFVHTLVKEDLYKNMLKLPDGPHCLALTAVAIADYCNQANELDPTQSVQRLLTAWMGVSTPLIPTPESVIDLLYGEGTFTLCFNPLADEGETVATLKALRLPVRHSAGQEKEIPVVTLPPDLSA